MRSPLCVAAILLVSLAAFTAGPKIEKAEVQSGGEKRTYYFYVPESAKAAPAPLLLLLHGSGHNGESLLKNWKGQADKEGIILVGPDAKNPQNWNSSVDSPDFLRDVIVDVIATHNVDSQRLYVFGHSAGAMYSIIVGLLESKYFAAVAVHAGALQPQEYLLIHNAERKIPIGIWSGDWDQIVPIEVVRKTYEQLKAANFPAYFNPIPKHTHDYEAMADVINFSAWNFLKDKRNDSPEFTHYDWSQPKRLAPAK